MGFSDLPTYPGTEPSADGPATRDQDPPPSQRWPPLPFTVCVAVAEGRPSGRAYRTRDLSLVLTELANVPAPLSATVSVSDGRSTLGEFGLFVNASGAAWVQLLESCERVPCDPARAAEPGEVSGFVDVVREGDGFAVAAAEVLTREQATRALAQWLECGGRHPGFHWR